MNKTKTIISFAGLLVGGAAFAQSKAPAVSLDPDELILSPTLDGDVIAPLPGPIAVPTAERPIVRPLDRPELAEPPESDRPVVRPIERPELAERPERPELAERPERPELAERPERPELAERPERPERVDAPGEFGAFVQEQVAAGLRGRALAGAIRARHEAEGRGARRSGGRH